MGNLNLLQHIVHVTWFQLVTVMEKLGAILQTGAWLNRSGTQETEISVSLGKMVILLPNLWRRLWPRKGKG